MWTRREEHSYHSSQTRKSAVLVSSLQTESSKRMMQFVTMVVVLVSLTSASARFPRTDDENERTGSDNGKETPEIWKDARKEFKSVIKPTGAKVNFKETVDKLVPFINPTLTESDCKILCTEKLGSLLETSVPDESLACDALCKAALFKLEKSSAKVE